MASLSAGLVPKTARLFLTSGAAFAISLTPIRWEQV
jgi:hypothetical protein